MVAFREALDFCGLRDLGYVGSPFTWCNNQLKGVITWIKLDKGVATPSWTTMFPYVRVHHIASSLLNHSPLWVCSDDENTRFYTKRRPFRFEAVWMRDKHSEGVIKNAWGCHTRGKLMDNLIHKVEECRIQLQTWSRHFVGNI